MRLGRWQSVLTDVRCDAVITDPPYSKTTHSHDVKRSDGYDSAGLQPDYAPFTPADIREFVTHWHERTNGWIVALTDSVLQQCWRDEYERAGRVAFAPVVCVIRGMSVRIQQDGPSSWAVYAMAARPRGEAFAHGGALPGAYTGGTGTNRRSGDESSGGGRGKPRWLMNALVRDYSKPGDVVCDPYLGFGVTLQSCAELGRIGIGAECDPAAYAEAERRLGAPQQIGMAL
jgi:site-specific DNA-methyltransferase (adenine-specific)